MASVKETYTKPKGTGRPSKGYYLEKKRVPGVTTIVKHIDGDSGGLMFWAHKLGLEGTDMNEERNRSAAEGTAIHDAIAALGRGEKKDEILERSPDHQRKAIAHGIDAFLEWEDGSQTTLYTDEVPRVSPRGFGGTPDLIGRDRNGKLALADIKTGKLYPAAVLQIAAYGMLCEEDGLGEAGNERIESYHLLRFDRETGAFTHVGVPIDVIEEARDAFLMCLELYQFNKRLRRML